MLQVTPRDQLVFGSEVAQEAIDRLIEYYKKDVHLYLQDYEVGDKGGSFKFYSPELNVKPKLFVWTDSPQLRLLVLIHELGHFHHLKRIGYSNLIGYPRVRSEEYARWIGWAIIKQWGFHTFITKELWNGFSYHKIWRINVGLKTLSWKELKALELKKGDQDAETLIARGEWIR